MSMTTKLPSTTVQMRIPLSDLGKFSDGAKPEFSSWAVLEKRFHKPERFWLMELQEK
ncbi:MAG: hypothetical protein PHV34_23475 [Verrucomicrobiae bacterium]|nr:hypothetical protein [Verrucomicrobiae bacterium]